jgi:RNA polymerase sigma-70 factor (ECF subfamily)
MRTRANQLISTRWSLIQRLRNCDDQASWLEFFESYWRLLYSTAIRAGLTDAEAQDAVQETIIAVSRNINQLQTGPETGSFKNWLMRMARWRIIDQIRKRRIGVPLVMHDKNGAPDTTTAADDGPADPAGIELERIWEEEWRENLTEAALVRVQRQTSARHYQIFYLYVVLGTPVAKVSAATGATADEIYLVKHRLWPLFDRAVKAVEGCQRC